MMRRNRRRLPRGKLAFPLARILKDRQLTHYRFAASSGIPKGVVSRLTRPAANPTWKMVQRIAKALGLRVTFVPEGGDE